MVIARRFPTTPALMQELKGLVVHTLETNGASAKPISNASTSDWRFLLCFIEPTVPTGVLGQIRAELRANVYKATPPFNE